MPVHVRRRKEAAQRQHTEIGEGMPVQVVDHDAGAGDAAHFPEDACGVEFVEMVEEERRYGDIERVVTSGEVKRIPRLDTDAPPHSRR